MRRAAALLGAIVASYMVAGTLIVAAYHHLGDDPSFDPCAQGWPPEPACIPAGWKVIGPDGRVYRSGVSA